MSKLLLINLSTGEYYNGDKLTEIMSKVPYIVIDGTLGPVLFRGRPDSVTYDKEYENVGLRVAKAQRALTILERTGFKLYQER